MAEPPVSVQAYHDDGPRNLPPTRVVIHSTAPGIGYPGASAGGLAHATAEYFASSRAGGSAHYVVDDVSEEHCVADSHIAWHAPPNEHSLGIEICSEATYTRAQWLSPEVWPAVERAAARTADLCKRYGIPVVRIGVPELLRGDHGICGHVDVTNAWHESTHTDPGPGFPWDEFIAAVNGGAPVTAPVVVPGIAGKDDPMQCFAWPEGVQRFKLVAPVGKASSLVSRGWFSVACDGNIRALDVWFQGDHGGIAEAHEPVAKDGRALFDMPDGTTQITVHYDADGPVGAAIEFQNR